MTECISCQDKGKVGDLPLAQVKDMQQDAKLAQLESAIQRLHGIVQKQDDMIRTLRRETEVRVRDIQQIADKQAKGQDTSTLANEIAKAVAAQMRG